KGIHGRIITNFVVEKDGSLNEVKVVRGVDPLLDAEAVRVIQSMPNWKPGTQKGETVRVRYTLPVVFRLQQ
ncbi:MAG: energy transducer TonB, partial [Petrimonas sp.]|nr:energy transducer TonB [Petrimonas sp.]MDD4014662.1 energy transducer TonB [Petrimonas sp.]